jgi:hypothetical protein
MNQTDKPAGMPEPEHNAQRALSEVELIKVWEQIEEYLMRAYREPNQEALRRWASIFGEEIDVVRRARNSVAHAFSISDSTLEEALLIGRRLIDLARKGLQEQEEPR